MGKRMLACLGLLAGLVAGFVVGLGLTGPQHRIHREGWSALKKGMTPPEVEESLGTPPGDYRSQKTKLGPLMTTLHYWGTAGEQVAEWHGDQGTIRMQFDLQGKAIGAGYFPRVEDTFGDRIRRWMGLAWR